jgi:hypothetical protein
MVFRDDVFGFLSDEETCNTEVQVSGERHTGINQVPSLGLQSGVVRVLENPKFTSLLASQAGTSAPSLPMGESERKPYLVFSAVLDSQLVLLTVHYMR